MIEDGYLKTNDNESDWLASRDWLILPAMGLITILFLLTSTELIARKIYPKLSTMGEDCMVFGDAATGARAIPNSVCWDKLPDTELSEYRFDSCGHRAQIGCGPKPPGTYQIVVLGSSVAMGMRVPVEKTFATLLPQELSLRTGQSIRLYNEGMPWRPPRVIAAHIDDVIAEKPDLILWIISPADIGETSKLVRTMTPDAGSASSNKSTGARGLADSLILGSARRFVATAIQNQATGNLLRILLYRIRTLYVHNYLMRGSDADFLRSDPSPKWAENLNQFDGYADEIERKAKLAGVPVVAAFLPNRAQAAMLSMGTWPKGSDPYWLDRDLRAIVEKHGGTYLDIVPNFRTIPNAEFDYYPVDGHPNAQGHALITGMLADAFIQSSIPGFRSASEPDSSEHGR